MRYKTIERYRRAAALIRARGLRSTATAVAKELRLSQKHMHDMLNKWPELRSYSGIERSMHARKERYEAAIKSLEEKGLLVTAAAVAAELEMHISGVYKYNDRHFSDKRERPSSRSAALKEEYRRAVARMREAGHPLTRKSLAIELGKPISTVQQYLWSHPEIREELGIDYTNEGHRAIYEKKT